MSQMMRTRRSLLTAGITTAASVALGPMAFAKQAPARLTVSGEPLRIGVFLDLSGPGQIQGRRQLLGINHRSQVLNQGSDEQLHLDVIDTRGERSRTRAEALRLISERHLEALVGTSAPGTSAVLAEVGQSAGIPVVMPSAGETPAQPYAFRSGVPVAAATTRMLTALGKAGLSRVAALSTVSNSPPSAWDDFRHEMAQHGLHLTDHQEFRPSVPDLREPLKTLLATGPDVLAVFTTPPHNGIAVQDARALGWSGPIFCSPAAGHPEFVKAAGAAIEGVRVVAPWVLAWRDAPATLPNGWAIRELATAFEAASGPVGTYVAYGAEAITMLHHAYYGHRSAPRARTELESMVHVGAVGVATMTPANHAALTTDCLTVARWQDDRWSVDPALG